jgi:hypothetical protein
MVKITAFCYALTSTAGSGTIYDFVLREGGTTLQGGSYLSASANNNHPGISIAVLSAAVATAGSHTYKVSIMQNGAGTLKCGAQATTPAFILVELI